MVGKGKDRPTLSSKRPVPLLLPHKLAMLEFIIGKTKIKTKRWGGVEMNSLSASQTGIHLYVAQGTTSAHQAGLP